MAPPSSGSYSASGLGVAEQVSTFYYPGYNLSQCGAVTITLRVMCKDFFLGNNCTVSPNDMAINAVEVIGPTGNIIASLNFQYLWALQTNYHSTSYTIPINLNATPLSAGTYTLKARSILEGGQSKYYGDVLVTIAGNCSGSQTLVPILRNQAAGGARIKTISLYDRASVLVSRKRYLYENPSFQGTFSSGKLMNPLMSFSQIGSSSINVSGSTVTYTAGAQHFVHTSGSALSNGQAAQGSHIGYLVVQEIDESNTGQTNGKKVYNFENNTTSFQAMNGVYNNFGVSRTVLEDVNGFNRGESVFSNSNSTISSVYKNYAFLQGGYLNSLKLYYFGGNKPLVSFYKIPTGLVVTDQVDTYLDGVSYQESFLYNSFNQLISIKKTKGTDILEETRFKYPTSFSISTSIINELILKNMMDIPIETSVYRSGGIVSSEGIAFSKEGSRVLAKRFFSHNLSLSFVPTSNGSDFSGGYELKGIVNSFDSYGNPKEIVKNNSLATAMIWDYSGTVPIAIAQNCLANELAFTSFETSEKGGWTYAGAPLTTNSRSGRKSYNLSSGSISKASIPGSSSNKIKVAFWAKTVSGASTVSVGGQTEALTTVWKYVEKIITTTSVTISGSNIIIDDLRLFPFDSIIDTYTYDPLLGLTSKMDTKGQLFIYEYDLLGRLKAIKDESGNIIEYYEYNYSIGN